MTLRQQSNTRPKRAGKRIGALGIAWTLVLAAIGIFLATLTLQDWMAEREGHMPQMSLPVLAEKDNAPIPNEALEAAMYRERQNISTYHEPYAPPEYPIHPETPAAIHVPEESESVRQPPRLEATVSAPRPVEPVAAPEHPPIAPHEEKAASAPVKAVPGPDVSTKAAPVIMGQKSKRPRVSIIVSGLGLQKKVLDAALQSLPPVVTLGFVPYAPNIIQLISRARTQDHEVLLTIPLEPTDFPKGDPGPYTLLAAAGDKENQQRLTMMLDSGDGYVGVVAFLGSKFLESTSAIQGLLRPLKDRNLLFVTNEQAGLGPLLTAARAEKIKPITNVVELDKEASGSAIDAQLARMVQMAQKEGYAVGIAQAYPISIERVTSWAAKVEDRGVDIVPITQVML